MVIVPINRANKDWCWASNDVLAHDTNMPQFNRRIL